MPQRVDKNRPARHPVTAFFEDSIITPVKKQVHQQLHDAGERFYDAKEFKANLLNKSAPELQGQKRQIEGNIIENYSRTYSTVGEAATRFHILPHSPSTYTTLPKAASNTVHSACNVTKGWSQLLHVRGELGNRGEPTPLWAVKDIPRAAWKGVTGGPTFLKAANREIVDQFCPVPTGAFYVNDPYPSQVLQTREEMVKTGDELVDGLQDLRKIFSDPPKRRG